MAAVAILLIAPPPYFIGAVHARPARFAVPGRCRNRRPFMPDNSGVPALAFQSRLIGITFQVGKEITLKRTRRDENEASRNVSCSFSFYHLLC
jgi:hypothetical protein